MSDQKIELIKNPNKSPINFVYEDGPFMIPVGKGLFISFKDLVLLDLRELLAIQIEQKASDVDISHPELQALLGREAGEMSLTEIIGHIEDETPEGLKILFDLEEQTRQEYLERAIK